MRDYLILVVFLVALWILVRLIRHEKKLNDAMTREGRRSFESDKNKVRTGTFLHRHAR